MLTELFKTKERLKILYYIMYQKSFAVSQVSKETGVSKGLVSRHLNYLNTAGLLNRSGHSYCPDDNAHTRAVKVLLNLNKLNIGSLDHGWAAGIGIFGSWAEGTNTYESDLDMWIMVDPYPSEHELARLQKDIRTMAGVEVNMLVLTGEKVERIKRTDMPFYNSLVRTSIILKGESIDRY
jgi:predicted nucleotidyltransferase